jgi:nicotinamidase-related amidase
MPEAGLKEPRKRAKSAAPNGGRGNGARRRYEDLMDETREQVLERVQHAYDRFMETRVWEFPQWLYGQTKGTLFRVEVEDNPQFGETAWLEFDSGRTAFVSIDMQVDFAGEHGYVDVMGYDLSLTATAIQPIRRCLEAVRGTDIEIIHTREGHLPDLSDAPFNKILRSKVIGKGVGIGEKPEGGLGRLLVRGDQNWDIVPELYPRPGEIIVDKAGKGVQDVSTFFMQLQNLDITHLIITGITTDVCVNTIMTEANDLGYWCLLLKDCTGATKLENKEATITQTKMQGGVFGWVSTSERFIRGLQQAGIRGNGKPHRIY